MTITLVSTVAPCPDIMMASFIYMLVKPRAEIKILKNLIFFSLKD